MAIDTSAASSRKEKVKIITEKLERGISDMMNSEDYKSFLAKMSKLHKYSFGNTVLILMQKPDATMVAGLNTFNKVFHRSVNKGEKGIVILAPTKFKRTVTKYEDGRPVIGPDGEPEKVEKEFQSFKPVYVFDVSQTHGEPIPVFGVDELSGSVNEYDRLFAAIESFAPVPVSFEEIKNGAKGYYSHVEKRIVLNEGMSDLQTMKTLIHETAHSVLHDKDVLKSTGEKKDRQTMEVEAESVAYTVASYFGLDASEYSFAYITGWSGGKKMEVIKESMETIRKCASEMITHIEGALRGDATPAAAA